MPREIDNYRETKFAGRNARLFREWEMIDQRCENDEQVKYIIRKRNDVGLPIVYDIYLTGIKSVIGVEEPDEQGLQRPIFGNEHILRITLPNNYPASDGCPEFKFTTDVWHPNIRYFGDYRGLVDIGCGGSHNLLVDYIDRLIKYLKYEDYWAQMEFPYPQDWEVAQWILKQAEPQGWIPFKQEENNV